MKKHYWIFIFVSALAILTILLWKLPIQPTTSSRSAREPVQPTQLTNALAGGTNVTSLTASSVTTAASSPQANSKPPFQNDRDKPEAFKQSVEAKNSPINFYGKVIDQDGNGIPGVQVKMTVRQWYVRSIAAFDAGAHFIPIAKETDADGRFEVNGETGDGFGILIVPKDGYLLSPKAPKGFGPSAGSFENPVIIKMWKEGAKEPLVGGSHVFGIIPDGRIYTLDLLNGKKIEGATEGDLQVSIVRPTDAKPRDKYQWSFMITGVGGGFLKSDDEFMYLAPESGYEPKFERQLNPADAAWTPLFKDQLFIRSRNGRIYGRIKIEVNAIYNDHSAIEINYAINPNGSINLQP